MRSLRCPVMELGSSCGSYELPGPCSELWQALLSCFYHPALACDRLPGCNSLVLLKNLSLEKLSDFLLL